MNTFYVSQFLQTLTPQTFHRVRMYYFVRSFGYGMPSEIHGYVAKNGKHSWDVVLNKNRPYSERKITIIHEFIHLILFMKKLDDPYESQKYSDKILTKIAKNLIQKYPQLASQLFFGYRSF